MTKKKTKKKTAKKTRKAGAGRKPAYGKQALTKLFTMRVSVSELNTLKKNGGAIYVRKKTGLAVK